MNYTVLLNEDQKIIVATAEGEWDAETDNAMVYEIMVMVGETGVQKVLLDIRELYFDFPLVYIFERAKEMREKRRKFTKVSTKTAFLYLFQNPKVEEDVRFFETVSRNRGLPYRMFKDVEEAMIWLTEDT